MPVAKPCPFCAGRAVDRDTLATNGETQYFYRCTGCAAEGGWAKTLAGALRMWNLRTNP